jgi:hypothetical protein
MKILACIYFSIDEVKMRENGWISVKEFFPEPGEYVLVCTHEPQHVSIARWHADVLNGSWDALIPFGVEFDEK